MKHRISAAMLICLCTFLCLAPACKKKKDADPVPVREQWTLMPKTQVYYGNRNIIAAYADEKNLFFLTPFMMYTFDSSMTKNNAQLFDVPGYDNGSLDVKFGREFRIFNNFDKSAIVVADNIRRYNASSNALLARDLHPGGEAWIYTYTAPGDQSVFYLAYGLKTPGTEDSVDIYLNCYKVVRNTYVDIDLQWGKKVLTNYHQQVFHGEVSYLNEAGGIVYMTSGGITFRLENGVVTDTLRHSIKSLASVGNELYANVRGSFFPPNEQKPEGLLRSVDKGKTWDYTGTGSSFADGRLQVMGGHLYLLTWYGIVQLDVSGGTKDINRIDGEIRSMSLFHDRVYIGTDAGVYVKSYKTFIED